MLHIRKIKMKIKKIVHSKFFLELSVCTCFDKIVYVWEGDHESYSTVDNDNQTKQERKQNVRKIANKLK